MTFESGAIIVDDDAACAKLVKDVESAEANLAACLNLRAKAKILMVDDEKLNCFVVAEYLKADGYGKLIHTSDPFQALSLATRERPDVILLDVEMPRLNGLDLLRQIRADDTFVRTAVIMITAVRDHKVTLQAIELGANAFLNKPIDCDDLLTRLGKILRAKANLDQNRH